MPNTFASQHYKISNGKLIPRDEPIIPSLNYRSIPYTPLNKPRPEDYQASYIQALKAKIQSLQNCIEHPEYSPISEQGRESAYQCRMHEQQISQLKHENQILKQKLLAQQSTTKKLQTRLLQKEHETSSLLNRNITLQADLAGIKNKLNLSQREANRIQSKLDKYSSRFIQQIQNVEKMILHGLDQEDNQKCHQGIAFLYNQGNKKQLRSIENSSQPSEDNYNFLYSSPRVRSEEREQQIGYITPATNVYHLSPRSARSKNTPKTQAHENSNTGSQLSTNLRNWGQLLGKTSISSLQLLEEDRDPVAGTLSNLFSRG